VEEPQYPINDLGALIKEIETLREVARWKMNLAKYGRAYFTIEYMAKKDVFIGYDNFYKTLGRVKDERAKNKRWRRERIGGIYNYY